MSRGKYLSLEEARKKKGGLARFAKEHPSEGDESLFDRVLRLMSLGGGTPEAEDQTSSEAASSDCIETQTPKGTSEDA
jgi:hypothetical protein